MRKDNIMVALVMKFDLDGSISDFISLVDFDEESLVEHCVDIIGEVIKPLDIWTEEISLNMAKTLVANKGSIIR